MEWGVAVALSDTMAPGLEGGVTQLAMALNGPAPALFNACREGNRGIVLGVYKQQSNDMYH